MELVKQEIFPSEDDVIGQIALKLAILDVTAPPRALTDKELKAFIIIWEHAWDEGGKYQKAAHTLRNFKMHELSTHNKTFANGSYPIHYGKCYWREYIKEAETALETAKLVLGGRALKEI